MTDGVGAFKGSMMRQTEKLGDRTRGASFLWSGRGWPIGRTLLMVRNQMGCSVLLRSRRPTGQIWAPVPKTHKWHSDPLKHVRWHHLHQLVFKRHRVWNSEGMQISPKECDLLCECCSAHGHPSPAIPDRQVRALSVLQSRMPWPRSTSAMTAVSGQISTHTLSVPPATDASESSTTTCTSIHQQLNKDSLLTAAGAPPPASLKVCTDPIPDWATASETTLPHCTLPGTADQWVLE
jgi:hypothetical protein